MIEDFVNNLVFFVNNLDLLKSLYHIRKLAIISIPFIIHVFRVICSWNEYVSNWSSINRSTVKSCGNKWFAFHMFSFSSGSSKECQERYRRDLKEYKIRYIKFFEKYVIFRENIWAKKKAKEQARNNKNWIRRQINEAIPGFLD